MRAIPANIRDQDITLGENTLFMLHQVFEHDPHFGNNIVRWLITEVDQMLAVRVIVMLLFFGAWIVKVVDLDLQPDG